jgi:hypothetical protein
VSFKDRNFDDRLAAGGMGDEAEGVFERVFPKGWARYGLNRPPIQMAKIPARLRYTPDYITTSALVEVQGFGRDQTFKLKIDKWQSLHWWNGVHPVDLFVWDTTNKRWCILSLQQIDLLVEQCGEIRHFPEGKAYMAIPGDAIFEAARVTGEGDGETA